jgi:hypothetical protein
VDEKALLGSLAPLMGGPGQERTHNGKKYQVFRNNVAIHFASPRLVVVGPEKGVQVCLDQKWGKPSGVIERGLSAIKGRHHGVFAVAVPAKATEAMRKGMSGDPQLAAFAALAEVQGVIYQADVAGNKLDVEITLAFDSDDKAAKGKEALVKARDFALEQLPQIRKPPAGVNLGAGAQVFDQMESALRALTIDQSGKDVRAKVRMDNVTSPQAMNDLMQAVQKSREAAGRAMGANNLHQLALAMHSYADQHGHFPPFIKYGANGQPLWSWRVELLPYLDHQDMYLKLKQDEPWNGPNNSKVLAKMPDVFQMPGKPTVGTTYYQVFMGPGAPFTNNFRVRTGPTFAQITDGASNTIMIAEARNPVRWASTAVADIGVNLAPGQPVFFLHDKVGVDPKQPFNVAMFDGSVRQIKRTAQAQHLAWAITPADGNPLPVGWEGK